MISVTEQAKSHLATALDEATPEEAEPEESCFRLVRGENNRLAMVLGRQTESDAVVEHGGKPLLAMDQDLAPALDGRTLDVEENEQGQPVLTLK